jgi:hypothetical protein
MKTFKTSRKFYKKWLFKVTVKVGAPASFRMYSLERIKEICQLHSDWKISKNPYEQHHWAYNEIHQNHNIVEPLVDCLMSKDSRLWAKRIEHKCIDIYTNDREFYEELSAKFKDAIEQRSEPDEIYVDLLDDPKTIICDKLPHNKYNFRVYLLPHKLAGDQDTKQKFINWLVAQSPKITCTPAVQNWFLKTNWNWDRRYVLVEDESTLLMMKLRNSEVVGTVYNYVITDK